MKKRYVLKNIIISTSIHIVFTLFCAALLLILSTHLNGSKIYVFALFLAIVVYFQYRFFFRFSFCNLIDIEADKIVFRSANPFYKPLKIEIHDIIQLAFVANRSKKEFIFQTQTGDIKVISYMHMVSLRNFYDELLALGLRVEISGLWEGYYKQERKMFDRRVHTSMAIMALMLIFYCALIDYRLSRHHHHLYDVFYRAWHILNKTR